MMQSTCCVTGHREIPLDQVEWVRRQLREEVACAVREGFTRFLSGYAQGVDLFFVEAVMEEMDRNPTLRLEAFLPYRARASKLMEQPRTKRLLLLAETVHVACEEYSPAGFHIRNRAMVDRSARVIAVHDGRQGGGTASTLRYAKQKGRKVREVLLGKK